MRNELEQIKKIEEYLNGRLPADEQAVFEETLSRDAELKDDVALQQELTKGIKRALLTERVRTARRSYLRKHYLKKWGGLGLGFVVVVVVVGLFFGGRGEGGKTGGVPGAVDTVKAGLVGTDSARGNLMRTDSMRAGLMHADSARVDSIQGRVRATMPASPESRIRPQLYTIDASQDTSLVTTGGIVFAIPAGSLLDVYGKVVQGPVHLVVREALDPATIMRSGLSTRSGDHWLETAGMFEVEADQNGKPVRVNPATPIFARVPTDSLRNDMQIFTGERQADGSIDWVNPRSPERYLIPLDIHTLDFYPPHYLDSVGHWGYAAGNRVFTDSLYYSLARFFVPGSGIDRVDTLSRDSMLIDFGVKRRAGSPTTRLIRAPRALKPDSSKIGVRDTIPFRANTPAVLNCGINPAEIKAIWADPFQNTLIATREFEQRLPYLHQEGNKNLLHLYLDHLDLPISVIDSMVARKVSGEIRQRFLSFAARHEGRVAIGSKQMDLLSNYYVQKTREYTAAIAREQKAFWDRQAALDATAQEKTEAYRQAEWRREMRTLEEQYNLSWRMGYTVSVTSFGWHNLDRYSGGISSFIASANSVVFRIDNARQYSAVYCYLLPNNLSSFIRVSRMNDTYIEHLWPSTSYSFVAIGYKGDSSFLYSRQSLQPGEYPALQLSPVDKATLDQTLQRLGSMSQVNDLRKETDYQAFRVQDDRRVQMNQQLRALTDAVLKVVFPCYVPQAEEGTGTVNVPAAK